MEQNKKMLSDGQLPGQQTIFHNMMLDIVSNAGVDEAFLMLKEVSNTLDRSGELTTCCISNLEFFKEIDNYLVKRIATLRTKRESMKLEGKDVNDYNNIKSYLFGFLNVQSFIHELKEKYSPLNNY